MEDRELKMNRKKMEYLRFHNDQDTALGLGFGGTDGELDMKITQCTWMEQLEKGIRSIV